MRVWVLADYCEWIGKDPSEHLHLRQMGISAVVRQDFDYSVRALKRHWDRRRDEQIMIVDTRPKHEKPKVPAPKYRTLFEVLGLNQDGTKPVTVTADARKIEDDLARQFLAGRVDWAEFDIA